MKVICEEPFTKVLSHTNILLFKATQAIEEQVLTDIDSIQKVSRRKIKIVKIDTSHEKIIKQVEIIHKMMISDPWKKYDSLAFIEEMAV